MDPPKDTGNVFLIENTDCRRRMPVCMSVVMHIEHVVHKNKEGNRTQASLILIVVEF